MYTSNKLPLISFNSLNRYFRSLFITKCQLKSPGPADGILTATLAFSLSSLASSFFSFLATSLSNASRCSTVRADNLSSSAAVD